MFFPPFIYLKLGWISDRTNQRIAGFITSSWTFFPPMCQHEYTLFSLHEERAVRRRFPALFLCFVFKGDTQNLLCVTVSFTLALITPSVWTCFAFAFASLPGKLSLFCMFVFFLKCTRARGRCLQLLLPQRAGVGDSSTLPAAGALPGRSRGR